MPESININPFDNPDSCVWVSYVVDGEVAFVQPFPVQAELIVAAVSSNPTLVVLEGDDRVSVKTGWTYVDGQFVPPTT